jgi:CubicO group peptidase (beta-lactamase class C family)
VAAAALVRPGAVVRASEASTPTGPDLDVLLQAAMRDRAVPAMSAVVIRAGRVGDVVCRGLRSSDGDDPVRAGDAWHIGSCSKAMTATVIARLVERGLLAWTTPLVEMLPDLADAMHPAYRRVTLVELLSHTAGLPAGLPIDRVLTYFDDARAMPMQRLDYARRALAEAPAAPPRTAFVYSNSGYVVSGLIAERAAWQPWERLVQTELFDPLGMRSAGFGATPPGQPVGHEGGRPATGPKAGNPLVLTPAGDVHVSMEDWARFVLDQMQGESAAGRLLRAETYRFLHAPANGIKAALGWGVRDGSPSLLTHTGSDGAWFAAVAMAPTKGNALLLAANAGEDADGHLAVLQVMKPLMQTLADW